MISPPGVQAFPLGTLPTPPAMPDKWIGLFKSGQKKAISAATKKKGMANRHTINTNRLKRLSATGDGSMILPPGNLGSCIFMFGITRKAPFSERGNCRAKSREILQPLVGKGLFEKRIFFLRAVSGRTFHKNGKFGLINKSAEIVPCSQPGNLPPLLHE